MQISRLTRTASETFDLGKRIGTAVQAPVSIALIGDLGSGKTTFVQGLAAGLGVPEGYYITSPTYTIVNDYPARIPLYHLDLYRLGSADDLEAIGFDDIVAQEAVVVIEWPEIIETSILAFSIVVRFEIDAGFNRKIFLSGYGLAGTNLLKIFESGGHDRTG